MYKKKEEKKRRNYNIFRTTIRRRNLKAYLESALKINMEKCIEKNINLT